MKVLEWSELPGSAEIQRPRGPMRAAVMLRRLLGLPLDDFQASLEGMHHLQSLVQEP